MTKPHPIFAKELDAFEEATKCFDIASTCRPIINELLLAALTRASLAVVKESVGEEDDICTGRSNLRKDTLATAREIIGGK